MRAPERSQRTHHVVSAHHQIIIFLFFVFVVNLLCLFHRPYRPRNIVWCLKTTSTNTIHPPHSPQSYQPTHTYICIQLYIFANQFNNCINNVKTSYLFVCFVCPSLCIHHFVYIFKRFITSHFVHPKWERTLVCVSFKLCFFIFWFFTKLNYYRTHFVFHVDTHTPTPTPHIHKHVWFNTERNFRTIFF